MKRRKRRVMRPKVCRFTEEGILYIDYKDVDLLSRYVTEKGKILPRRVTGTSPKHQKMLAKAIKRARNCGLMK
ncbi:MAG: 30S ribosomal protein S18 [Lentisphaeria bacterium]|nr:30S ribosomal protein S18 [Lentisphaeria bacterium]